MLSSPLLRDHAAAALSAWASALVAEWKGTGGGGGVAADGHHGRRASADLTERRAAIRATADTVLCQAREKAMHAPSASADAMDTG